MAAPHPQHPRTGTTHRTLAAPRTPKPRRPFGDPIAPIKETPRFEPPPFTNLQFLNLRLDAVMPEKPIVDAGQIVFHSVGDTGGIHGTDVQETIARQMEAQYNDAAAEADVVLDTYNDTEPGFLRVTIDATTLVGEYFIVPFAGTPPADPFDTFTLDWKTHHLM